MELQKLMIIQKPAKDLPLAFTVKTIVISLLTWSIWGYSLYVMFNYAKKIFVMPVFENYFFHHMIALMCIGSVILLMTTVIWSFIAKSYKRKVRRKPLMD